MASSFSFPVLPDGELLPCLREMEMPVTAAQMAKPTAELVRPIYEALVTNLTGLSRSVGPLIEARAQVTKRQIKCELFAEKISSSQCWQQLMSWSFQSFTRSPYPRSPSRPTLFALLQLWASRISPFERSAETRKPSWQDLRACISTEYASCTDIGKPDQKNWLISH